MANELPRQTRKIPNTDEEISEPLVDYQERERRLNARLVALWLHHQYTSNIYFPLEALNLCLEAGVNPPAWVLGALRPGIAAHLGKPARSLDICLGTRRRRSGVTQPVDQFKARHALDAAMREMWKLCEVKGKTQKQAAWKVKEKHSLSQRAATLEKIYRTKWAPLYRELLGRNVSAK